MRHCQPDRWLGYGTHHHHHHSLGPQCVVRAAAQSCSMRRRKASSRRRPPASMCQAPTYYLGHGRCGMTHICIPLRNRNSSTASAWTLRVSVGRWQAASCIWSTRYCPLVHQDGLVKHSQRIELSAFGRGQRARAHPHRPIMTVPDDVDCRDIVPVTLTLAVNSEWEVRRPW